VGLEPELRPALPRHQIRIIAVPAHVGSREAAQRQHLEASGPHILQRRLDQGRARAASLVTAIHLRVTDGQHTRRQRVGGVPDQFTMQARLVTTPGLVVNHREFRLPIGKRPLRHGSAQPRTLCNIW